MNIPSECIGSDYTEHRCNRCFALSTVSYSGICIL